jgi:hypothetical protein
MLTAVLSALKRWNISVQSNEKYASVHLYVLMNKALLWRLIFYGM